MKTPEMKNLILTLLIAFTTGGAYAQTQLIAHKSHSGSSANFAIDPSAKSNFGLSPMITYKDMAADTVGMDSLFRHTVYGKRLLEILKQCKDAQCFYDALDQKENRMVMDSLRSNYSAHEPGASLYRTFSSYMVDYVGIRKFILNRAKNLGYGYHPPQSDPFRSVPAWAGLVCIAGIGTLLYRKSKVV